MKITSAQHAKEYVATKIKKVQPGAVYDIYACGCVYRSNNQNRAYTKGSARCTVRCCPKHDAGGLLLGKFKQCKCGEIFFNKFVAEGESCAVCRGTNRSAYLKKMKTRHTKKTSPSRDSLHNAAYADPSRYNCKFRSKCLTKYSKCDAIPCKDCRHYWPVSIEAEMAKQGYRITRKGFDLIAVQL